MNRTLLAKVASIVVAICALGLTGCAVGSSGNIEDGGTFGCLGDYINPVDKLSGGGADENTVNVMPSKTVTRGVIRE